MNSHIGSSSDAIPCNRIPPMLPILSENTTTITNSSSTPIPSAGSQRRRFDETNITSYNDYDDNNNMEQQEQPQRMKKSRTDAGIASSISVRLSSQKLQHQQRLQRHVTQPPPQTQYPSSISSTASTCSLSPTTSGNNSWYTLKNTSGLNVPLVEMSSSGISSTSSTATVTTTASSSGGYVSEDLDELSMMEE